MAKHLAQSSISLAFEDLAGALYADPRVRILFEQPPVTTTGLDGKKFHGGVVYREDLIDAVRETLRGAGIAPPGRNGHFAIALADRVAAHADFDAAGL